MELTSLLKSDQEHTLVLIKPDGYERGLTGQVLSRIERRGYRLVGLKIAVASRELLTEHYYEHQDQHFFGDLITYMSSGPTVAVVVEGHQVIKAFRAMMGATNPLIAAPGTIRGDLGRDWGGSSVRNIVHGSDTPESADREIALWFPELIED